MKSDKMKTDRRNVLVTTAALSGRRCALGGAGGSHDFPTRPIQVVVPFPAGGTTDVVARVFAERMERELGQPVVVENRAGGGGSVGADYVARADADGHTLLFHNITFSATTTVMQHEGRALHDIEEDFAPVSIAVLVPMLLLAHPDLEFPRWRSLSSWRESGASRRCALLRHDGARLDHEPRGRGHQGGGRDRHGARPFPGAAPMVQDLARGARSVRRRPALHLVRARAGGPPRGLAVLADERNFALPDVPTVGEVGFDTLNLVGFNGFIAPAGTPDDVIDRIREAVLAAAEDPEVRERMERMGAVDLGLHSGGVPSAVLAQQVSQMRPSGRRSSTSEWATDLPCRSGFRRFHSVTLHSEPESKWAAPRRSDGTDRAAEHLEQVEASFMKLLRFGDPGALRRPGMLDADGTGPRPQRRKSPTWRAMRFRRRVWPSLAALDPDDTAREVTGTPRLGPPVAGMTNFVCIGLNYADHAAETGAEVPKEPIVFLKSLGALAGPDDDIVIPPGSKKTDWECELAVVIGTTARRVSDWTRRWITSPVSRSPMTSPSANGRPSAAAAWDKGKGFDTFGPLGPWLVTRDEIADPQNLAMYTDVDGKRMQDGSTATMIFGVRELVSYVSQCITLHPGDVIATGTPPGVGLGIKPHAGLPQAWPDR
jgi:ureidoglycolate lyase